MPDSGASPDPAICIVDDSASVRRSLARLISLEGWTVECFENGEDFLGYARGNRVDLVLVDLYMPGMGGLEVLSKLRGSSPCTSVIIITAGNDEGVRELALDQGAKAFLLKPFKDGELVAAVRSTNRL